MPFQDQAAILLPIWIIGYTLFENDLKRREQLPADSYQDVHLGFAFTDPALKVLPITGNTLNRKDG
jgi:hypothetical protein